MVDHAVPGPKEAEALTIVNGYIGWTAGAGLIPVPLADLAAITLVQLKMLDSLSKLYGVPFNRNLAKNLIGTLVGSLTPFAVATPAASLVKLVPVIGSFASSFALPAIAGASTFALGKVFIQHFESGGTFLDFDPKEVSSYFESQFESRRAAAEPEKKPAKAA